MATVQFGLTPDQELFRSTTRQFLERTVDSVGLRSLAAQGGGVDRSWWVTGAELGWTSMLVPAQQGGGAISGSPLTDLAIIAQEHGQFAAPGPLLVTNVIAGTLADQPDAGRYAPSVEAMMSGKAIGAWPVYEPGRGWAPYAPTMTASPCGTGFVLKGVKDRVEAGDQADLFLVAADVDGALTQFLVPAASHGLSVETMWSLDLTRRYATVTFDDVAVSAEAVVGRVGGAAAAIKRQCMAAAVLQCAETVGATDRVFDMTLQWAFDRYSFGRQLASYQAIKHRFAGMKMWLEAMHATTDDAVGSLDADSMSSDRLSLIASIFVSTRALDIMQECVQIHGGIGVTWEHDLHIYLRRATVNRAFYGTPDECRQVLTEHVNSALVTA